MVIRMLYIGKKRQKALVCTPLLGSFYINLYSFIVAADVSWGGRVRVFLAAIFQ